MKRIIFVLYILGSFLTACSPIASVKTQSDPSLEMKTDSAIDGLAFGFDETTQSISGNGRNEKPSSGMEQTLAAQPGDNPQTAYDKKVYFGFLTLLVKDASAIRKEIIGLTNANGGFVESFSMATVIIRVPKTKFGEVIEKIEGMGKLKAKSIQTYDVSETYEDYSLRLSIASGTRSRLYYLLELTKDVKERLSILKEIQRLTEEIERIQQYLQSLDSMIQYSKIYITLESAISPINDKDYKDIPFRWIADIKPFGGNDQKINGTAKSGLPGNYAVLEKKKNYFAVNPFGTNLLVYTVENKPEGDGEFWRKALVFNLSPFYESCESVDFGGIKGAIFKSTDQDPFYMFVGVSVMGDRLFVIKALFPTQDQYDKEYADVGSVIEKMELKK